MARPKNEEVTIDKPFNPNEDLGLEKFDYNKDIPFTPEQWDEYQKITQSLQQRKPYDWVEYNAVGIFKMRHDEEKDQMVETNILIGIKLLKTTPLKKTRMEVQHIEFWATDKQGRLKMMSGLNAQIYDKNNRRENSRFYLLKKVEVVNG